MPAEGSVVPFLNMITSSAINPLLQPIRDTFLEKRNSRTGLVPRNWLLILLCILDTIRESKRALVEDDIYSYDFTLKGSRAQAIPKLLTKYSLPTKLGMSGEGVTVRGAPGLRFFRAIQGGALIARRSKEDREALIAESVEVIRGELLKVLGQKPVELDRHLFDSAGAFVPALLEAVENRSHGRVEQALVGAKLQLRFPNVPIADNAGYAGDRQTGRESDFEVNNIRVIVSVSPKKNHVKSAETLADQGRSVFLVVADKSFSAAKDRIQRDGYARKVKVVSVDDYVTGNMMEIAGEQKITQRDMCMKLVAEYNRRAVFENDHSLQVVLPEES